MVNLPHRASLHFSERIAPAKKAVKHLVSASRPCLRRCPRPAAPNCSVSSRHPVTHAPSLHPRATPVTPAPLLSPPRHSCHPREGGGPFGRNVTPQGGPRFRGDDNAAPPPPCSPLSPPRRRGSPLPCLIPRPPKLLSNPLTRFSKPHKINALKIPPQWDLPIPPQCPPLGLTSATPAAS